MDFTRRAEVRRLETSTQRRWRSHDGRFVVIEVVSHFDLPRRYLAVRRLPDSEVVIGRHRNKRRAEQACRKAAK